MESPIFYKSQCIFITRFCKRVTIFSPNLLHWRPWLQNTLSYLEWRSCIICSKTTRRHIGVAPHVIRTEEAFNGSASRGMPFIAKDAEWRCAGGHVRRPDDTMIRCRKQRKIDDRGGDVSVDGPQSYNSSTSAPRGSWAIHHDYYNTSHDQRVHLSLFAI